MRLLTTALILSLFCAVLNTGDGRKIKEKRKTWINLATGTRTLEKIHHEKKEELLEKAEKGTTEVETKESITDEKGDRRHKKSGLLDKTGDLLDKKNEHLDKKSERFNKKSGRLDKKMERLDKKSERLDIKGERPKKSEHHGKKKNDKHNKHGKKQGEKISLNNETVTFVFPAQCNTNTDCGENACCVRKGRKQICKEAPNRVGKHCSISCPCSGELFCNMKKKGRNMRGKCLSTAETPHVLKSALNKLHKIAKGLKRGKGKREGKREEKRNKNRKRENRKNNDSNGTDH